jgi:TRAP-type C4-dicarboxylate transport system substrate-binding protein|tara:strand:- start:141 stop:1205 length:1065 start_codon:yes stop_codon:yes gene_type:complete
MLGVAAAGMLAGSLWAAMPADAKTINIRIASGHPPTVVYAGLMKNYFEPELKKAVESKTSHKINFIEGYSGSIVKVFDTFEGVQNGVVDIGGFCYCFEASKLPMHAFQIMLPFGTMDPVQSVAIAADVYGQFPRLAKRFQRFNQTLLAIIGDGGYNLGTQFAWKKVSDLKGRKILGAGLNLNWLRQAGIGIIPVTDGLPGWYQKLKTGVAEGGIMFPSAWGPVFKLHEVGKFYTSIGFGSITWHGLTVNNRYWASLPPEVKPIFQEVADRYEIQTGVFNKAGYKKDMNWLRKNITVSDLPADVRLSWAKGLKHWPQQHANELEKKGFPAKRILNATLDAAEKVGYKWPVRYTVK